MNKKNVVIEEGGMRYVLAYAEYSESCHESGCVLCGPEDKNNICKEKSLPVYEVCCSDDMELACISATKITPQPRIYHAWDRCDARSLVDSSVESHNGDVNGVWVKRVLVGIGVELGKPFKTDRGDGVFDWVPIIREIPRTTMTLADAMKKYFPDNIEIVEVY